MGKRERRNEVKGVEEGPNFEKDNGRDGIANPSTGRGVSRTRNKKEVLASPANKENLDDGEAKAANSATRISSIANAKAGSGRKHVAGKAAASGSKGGPEIQQGESGAKRTFVWNSAQEIIALAELIKSTNVDTGQPYDTSIVDWEQLAATVGQRLHHNLTRTQIYEKARRLKERYVRLHKLVGKGKSKIFKNEDEESVYKLSQQIWGSLEARSNQKKSSDAANMHMCGSLPDVAEVEITGETVEKEHTPKMCTRSPCEPPSEPKEGTTTAHTHTSPDPNLLSEYKINATVEGDTQKTLDLFHTEHQALLKQLEKSCATVLLDMQEKFLSMMNNTFRGSHFPWLGGGGGCISSFDYTQAPFSWDKLVDKCLASATSSDQPPTFENLCEQWQQQRLQELKLTSMKLQLMLEDCKLEQEKLERQVSKKPKTS